MSECRCAYYELHDAHWSHSFSGVVCKPQTTPPWAEALKCAVTNDPNAYKAYWPRFNKLRDCCITALISDYYLYELIKFESGYKKAEQTPLFDHFLSLGFKPNAKYAAGKEAENRQARLVAKWINPIKEYLHFATVAELTHCLPFVQTFGEERYKAFWGWGILTKKIGRATAVEYAHDLFTKVTWPTAFGGKRWSMITEILKYGEQGHIDGHPLSDHLFLDRVFSLEHNTGAVFSKFSNWNTTRYYKISDPQKNPHSIPRLYSVLEAHHIGDVDTLVKHASPLAANLYLRGIKDARH